MWVWLILDVSRGPLDLAMRLALGEIRVDVGFGWGCGGIRIWHEIWIWGRAGCAWDLRRMLALDAGESVLGLGYAGCGIRLGY